MRTVCGHVVESKTMGLFPPWLVRHEKTAALLTAAAHACAARHQFTMYH